MREALKPPVDGLGILDENTYVSSAPTQHAEQPDPQKLSPEQLHIRKRRFPELLEEQQRENSATDPDYFEYE